MSSFLVLAALKESGRYALPEASLVKPTEDDARMANVLLSIAVPLWM
jgi:hypothetical protein